MLVRVLVVALERTGIARARYLAEAGLETLKLDDIQARIPLESYWRAVRAAYALSADPAFGLHLGEHLSMTSFDVLGYLTEHSACLRDALSVSVRYARFINRGPRVEFNEHADSATLRVSLPETGPLEAQFASEFSAIAILRLMRSFAGDDALPRRVFFTHPRPAHAHEYVRLFAGREQFSHAFTGLEIDRAWLDCAPAFRDSELRTYLSARAELLLAKADRDVSTSERVKRWLASQPELARPTLDVVAHDLGMSTRSLRRHLHGEQLQFSTLVDEARAAHAKRTMADPRRSIQDIAYALGFCTPSAFTRAFKRWTGSTPKAYRSALDRSARGSLADSALV